jgi:flagellar hook-length control protein FliK
MDKTYSNTSHDKTKYTEINIDNNKLEVPAKPTQANAEVVHKDIDHKAFQRVEMVDKQIQFEQAENHDDSGKTEKKSYEGPLMRSTVHTGERSLDALNQKEGAPPLPRDTQTDVIRQIVDRMTLRSDRGQSQMHIKLKPEFLGDLRLQVTTENHHVMIRITAESPAVKEMIEQNLQFLKTELQHHGLQIDKFDVFVGQDQETWKHRQQQNASHESRQGKATHTHKRSMAAMAESETPLTNHRMGGQDPTGLKEVDFFA